ncbi:MAG: hypothetical protein LBC93_03255 [Synergistaceae bacterium]|nr:hypothetical protein [Synergistaceae bacterium]
MNKFLIRQKELPPASNWIDAADTSWYDPSQSSFTITTAEQLAGLAKLVNSETTFSDKTVRLANNIDLAGKEWTPIGDSDHFAGIFEGNNNTITNMTITGEVPNAGLFGGIDACAAAKNIRLTNMSIASSSLTSSHSGGVVGWNSGTVLNCTSSGSVSSYSDSYSGGVVGCNSGTVLNCTSSGSVSSSYSSSGGVVGLNGGTVTSCHKPVGRVSTATTEGLIFAGGVIGSNVDFLDEVLTEVSGNDFSLSATGQSYGIGYDDRAGGDPSNDGAPGY